MNYATTRRCRRLLAMSFLFTSGYLVCKDALMNSRKECRNLDQISTVDDLPVLRDTPERRNLNKADQNGKRMGADDPRVVSYIRSNCDVLLRPPDGNPTTYKKMGGSMGQEEIVHRMLRKMTGGFFVEFGGMDGIYSNTLRLERDYNWKGLIIEPDPSNLVQLHRNHRNAWISHSCVAVKTYPHEVTFRPGWDIGQILQVIEPQDQKIRLKADLIRVQCFPLYSFLVTLNISVVDFMSVDTEGYDLEVLKTIPFDKVMFRVVTVEIVTAPGGPGPIQEFMESQGFKTAGTFYHTGVTPFDLIFVHNSVEMDASAIQLIKTKYYNKAYPP